MDGRAVLGREASNDTRWARRGPPAYRETAAPSGVRPEGKATRKSSGGWGCDPGLTRLIFFFVVKTLWKGDPSAGWIHGSADCSDDNRVAVERLATRFTRSGLNRCRDDTYRLTCSCGASTTYTHVEPDPDHGEQDPISTVIPLTFDLVKLRAVFQELEKVQEIVKPLGFLAGVHVNVKGDKFGAPPGGGSEETYRFFFDGMKWHIVSFSAIIREHEERARQAEEDQENSLRWI